MTAIPIADVTFDRAAVDAFCAPLRDDPPAAVYLAASLLGGTLLPVRVLELRARMDGLPAWVRAGVVDELRDVIDRQLDGVFVAAVGVARGEGDEPVSEEHTASDGGSHP